MDLVRTLGPDDPAAALGQFLEVRGARLDRVAVLAVLHEQALDRLARRGPGDALLDRDPQRLPGLRLDGHVRSPNQCVFRESRSIAAGGRVTSDGQRSGLDEDAWLAFPSRADCLHSGIDARRTAHLHAGVTL